VCVSETSAQDGVEWSVSRSACFTPGTHRKESLMDIGAGLDAVTNRKLPLRLTEYHAMKTYGGVEV